jgi:hypothetical protein
MGATKPSVYATLLAKQEELNKIQNSIMQSTDKDAREKLLEFYKNIYDSAYDRHRSYTTLVISAGYVGFFSFWRAVKEILPTTLLLLSGLLMTISVCIFIVYEIYKMISDGLFYKKINEIFISSDTVDIIKEIQKKEQEHKRNLYCIWFNFLLPTLFTAFFGAIFLIASLYKEIFSELLAFIG